MTEKTTDQVAPLSSPAPPSAPTPPPAPSHQIPAPGQRRRKRGPAQPQIGDSSAPSSAPTSTPSLYQEYFRGNLARERATNPAVDKIAAKMWAMYNLGQVVLVQRRAADGKCAYLFKSLPPPHVPIVVKDYGAHRCGPVSRIKVRV